jgi:DnaJ-class molecular chaperone
MQLTECFRILQVEPGAPWQVIKKSYYSLAKRLHPDINPQSPNAELQFKEINQAFQVLRSHLSRPGDGALVKVEAKTWTFLLQRIVRNPKLQKLKGDCAAYLCQLDTRIFQLNVYKKIHVSTSTAQSGANIYLKSGREKFEIKVPSGDWNQMSLSIPGKGEPSLFSKRRGDLILNLQTPQTEMVNAVASCFSYEMAIDKARIGSVMTLNSSEGPIKFVLPRNTVNGQTFCLKSRADSESKHVLTVRLN